jgi:hypothetical protein
VFETLPGDEQDTDPFIAFAIPNGRVKQERRTRKAFIQEPASSLF